MTRNLKIYLALSLAWSFAFFAVLHWATAASPDRWGAIVASGLAYGLGFALAGWLLGSRDDQAAVRYSLPFAYAAASNAASGLVGVTWILLFRPAAVWGAIAFVPALVAFLLVGWLLAKRSIKGMSRRELFR